MRQLRGRPGLSCALLALGLGLPDNASATPLHGLQAVFNAQNADAYGKYVDDIVDKAELTNELRSGTVEDLRKRKTAGKPKKDGDGDKPSKAAGSNPSAGKDGAASSKLRGRAGAGKRRPAADKGAPALVGRKLKDGSTKTIDLKGDANDAQLVQARMQARELIEVLAYFNAENVNWDGHMGAECDYAAFRATALAQLPRFGRLGAEAVAQAIGEELTGVTIPREVTSSPESYISVYNSVYAGQANNPLTRDRKLIEADRKLSPEEAVQRTLLMNPSYHADLAFLLEHFEQEGLLTEPLADHLRTFSSGQKDADVKGLASKTKEILKSGDGLLGWLKTLDEEKDKGERSDAVRSLAKHSPSYADVKDDLPAVWQFSTSKDKQAAQAARAQMDNAFQRAPIGECLRWLGQDDPELRKLIWRQLDDRLQRANAERKAGYGASALKVLANDGASPGSRQAAAQLLGKLKDRKLVETLVDVLPELPRGVRPFVGDALKAITGEDFGPREGDGVAELTVALKKWRTWLEANEKP